MRLTLDVDIKKDILKELELYGDVEIFRSSCRGGYHYVIRGLSKEVVKKLRLKYDDKKRLALDNIRLPISRNVLFENKKLMYRGIKRRNDVLHEGKETKIRDTNNKSILDY